MNNNMVINDFSDRVCPFNSQKLVKLRYNLLLTKNLCSR